MVDSSESFEDWEKRFTAKVQSKTKHIPGTETELQKEQEKIKQAFITVASTDAGQVMLKALMLELGFKDTTIPGKTITNKDDILCNEIRRRVWIMIRKLLPKELRNIIEQD